MSKSVALLAALAASAAVAGTSAHAATILSVKADAACDASGCFSGGNVYRQAISASALAGGLSGLRLDRSMLGHAQNQVVRITFTRADGSKVGDWGGYVFAAVKGDTLSVLGSEIDWTALDGDLILNLEAIPGGGAGGVGGAAPRGPGVHDPSFPFPGRGQSQPPATPPPFVSAPPAESVIGVVVPEPQSWALMLVGFGGAGALLRRQRRAVARA